MRWPGNSYLVWCVLWRVWLRSPLFEDPPRLKKFSTECSIIWTLLRGSSITHSFVEICICSNVVALLFDNIIIDALLVLLVVVPLLLWPLALACQDQLAVVIPPPYGCSTDVGANDRSHSLVATALPILAYLTCWSFVRCVILTVLLSITTCSSRSKSLTVMSYVILKSSVFEACLVSEYCWYAMVTSTTTPIG